MSQPSATEPRGHGCKNTDRSVSNAQGSNKGKSGSGNPLISTTIDLDYPHVLNNFCVVRPPSKTSIGRVANFLFSARLTWRGIKMSATLSKCYRTKWLKFCWSASRDVLITVLRVSQISFTACCFGGACSGLESWPIRADQTFWGEGS